MIHNPEVRVAKMLREIKHLAGRLGYEWDGDLDSPRWQPSDILRYGWNSGQRRTLAKMAMMLRHGIGHGRYSAGRFRPGWNTAHVGFGATKESSVKRALRYFRNAVKNRSS